MHHAAILPRINPCIAAMISRAKPEHQPREIPLAKADLTDLFWRGRDQQRLDQTPKISERKKQQPLPGGFIIRRRDWRCGVHEKAGFTGSDGDILPGLGAELGAKTF